MKLSLKPSHVRLFVPNIRECFLFYRDILGLEVLHGNEDTPFAEFQTGDINIALEPLLVNEPLESMRRPHEFSVHDQVAIIFRADDVDSIYEQLKSKDVKFVKEPHDTLPWGHRVAYFRDPAGNLIEINKGL